MKRTALLVGSFRDGDVRLLEPESSRRQEGRQAGDATGTPLFEHTLAAGLRALRLPAEIRTDDGAMPHGGLGWARAEPPALPPRAPGGAGN